METKYKIILGSNSPRRKVLLSGLDIDFKVMAIPDINEDCPDGIPAIDMAEYISMEKAGAYRPNLAEDELVITADTVVVLDGKAMGKPHSLDEAREMLNMLSGRVHHVVTGVCLTTSDKQRHFSVVTAVTFKKLSEAEIDYYVEHYRPLDKAGAYGIQEWIGYVGVTSIEGSYFNVMGLPVQRIYDELLRF